MLTDYIEVSPEVRAALDAKQAVVALESTIIYLTRPDPEFTPEGRKQDKEI